MTAESRPKHADRSLASRDAALPGLPYLLDNQRLLTCQLCRVGAERDLQLAPGKPDETR